MQISRFLCDGQRCGVGRKDFQGGHQKGVGANADLAVCVVASDVVCEYRFSGVRGGQRCGVVNADLAGSAAASDVV